MPATPGYRLVARKGLPRANPGLIVDESYGFADGFADGFVDGFVDMEAGHQRRRVASPYERKRNEWERA